ncbi:hypothetical protein V6255_03330 [Psychromonas arctica]|uniref:Uncharacterized protein n=1 Tax=Psychromonas arctica TaxID=168275 RepID=A0ABU9H8W3_9GAMM
MTTEEGLCKSCNTPFNNSRTLCDVCQSDIGFPNVRAAIKNQKLLDDRFKLVMASINSRQLEVTANNYKNAVNDASVVIARSMTSLLPMIDNSNVLLSTFHHQVASNARLAENNEFDPKREAVESLLHPFYYKDVHYAALSLDSVGIKYYGDVHIQFKDNLIKHRTSFFEENPFNFVKKHKIIVGENIPGGYSATWEEKWKLALCKSHANLTSDLKSNDDFKNILVVECEKNPDFIEAHIFGTIHVACINKVTMFSDADKTSMLLFNANKSKFSTLNIDTEVRGM